MSVCNRAICLLPAPDGEAEAKLPAALNEWDEQADEGGDELDDLGPGSGAVRRVNFQLPDNPNTET